MDEFMDTNHFIKDNELEKSYIFVLNNIDVQGELPVEVAPGHYFKKANIQQIENVKKWIRLYLDPIWVSLPYEVEFEKIPAATPGSFKYQQTDLPDNMYRYWVIEFEGADTEIHDIESAASLLQHDLELGFTFLYRNKSTSHGGIAWHGPSLFNFFNTGGFHLPAVSITDKELYEIPENYELIKKINPEYPHISRALRKIWALKSLPRPSELVIIGLFSIIESLVTHSPKLTESADSLTHQIKTKIPLLRKRFQRELNYDQYFNPASEEIFWSRLYKYRSCIVHGEEPNFQNDLQILKGRDNVLEFLKETVKLLLLLSLKEPVLVSDLKKC